MNAATPTYAGAMPLDHEVAAVKFGDYPKTYYYWVPKAWKVQPGDVLKVLAPSSFATVVHSGQCIGASHKCAFAIHKRAGFEPPLPIVMGDGLNNQCHRAEEAIQITETPKEPTAMNIENQTLINGQNIKNLTDDQLFDLIAAEEAKIKALRAIENKPQKLKDRLNKMQADIDHLIRLIDER